VNPHHLLGEAERRLWMQRLLRRAEQIGCDGEVPVFAAVLDGQGRCIGYGGNRREREQDPLGHAELVALHQATQIKGDWRCNDCTLLVTLEPCPMCAGALVQARMGQVIFAAWDSKRGALGSTMNLSQHPSAHHRMAVMGGVMAAEATALLRNWFRLRRQRPIGTGAALSQTG
jgi:tRNA(adenine34) deaminase